jgi:dipeptidyl aminopeptidase/acylaminoacyl peptidase
VLDLPSNTAWQPELPAGVITGLGFSADGGRLGLSLTSATSAGDAWSWDLGTRTLTRWTHSELGGIDQARLAEPRLVRFRSFDGLSVPAFVYRPKGVGRTVRKPVIVDIHGGPEAQTRPGWNPGAQYFADLLGATVILPKVRGSDGYGKTYLNLDNGPKREDSVRDIGALLDWIRSAAGPRSEARRRLRQSYGGYMSLASMLHYSTAWWAASNAMESATSTPFFRTRKPIAATIAAPNMATSARRDEGGVRPHQSAGQPPKIRSRCW